MKELVRQYNMSTKVNKLEDLFVESGNDTLRYVKWGDVGVNCSDLVWDSLIWVVIEWIVCMWEVWNTANFEVIWNSKDEKMQYFSSANINNNTIINYARKKAELLCRWKWNDYNNTDKIICASGQNIEWYLDGASSNINWKTLIVKNWNVTITPSSKDDDKYYDIFIDSWNLIINETSNTKKFVIKDNGFVSSTSPSNFNRNVLVGYLHNTGASIEKIRDCISYFSTAMTNNCSRFRSSENEEYEVCESCEESETCEGGDSCGEYVCGVGEKCTAMTRTIQTFNYTWCMEYLSEEEWGPCSLDWWLDITMDPNGDGMVSQGDIDFLNDCSANGNCSVWNDVAIASIIKWNFIVDGNVLGPNRPSDTSFDKKLKNKYFIYWKLSSRDSFQTLQDTFAWRCNNWYTTDDSYCLPSNTSYSNPYEDAFLVVIDQNYESSPFFSAS